MKFYIIIKKGSYNIIEDFDIFLLRFELTIQRKIKGADQCRGILGFADKTSLWQTRRALAKDFWVD